MEGRVPEKGAEVGVARRWSKGLPGGRRQHGRPRAGKKAPTGKAARRVDGAGVGVARRWNKGLPGGRRQHGRPRAGKRRRSWRGPTVEQGLAGRATPTEPESGPLFRLVPFQGSRSETEFIGFAGKRARTEPESGLLFRLFPFQGLRSKTEFIGFAGRQVPTCPVPRGRNRKKNHPRVKRGVFNDRAKPMLLALRVQRVI